MINSLLNDNHCRIHICRIEDFVHVVAYRKIEVPPYWKFAFFSLVKWTIFHRRIPEKNKERVSINKLRLCQAIRANQMKIKISKLSNTRH